MNGILNSNRKLNMSLNILMWILTIKTAIFKSNKRWCQKVNFTCSFFKTILVHFKVKPQAHLRGMCWFSTLHHCQNSTLRDIIINTFSYSWLFNLRSLITSHLKSTLQVEFSGEIFIITFIITVYIPHTYVLTNDLSNRRHAPSGFEN